MLINYIRKPKSIKSMKSMHKWLRIIVVINLTACATGKQVDPYFANSVVSHDIDLILDDDPTTLATIEFIGNDLREMPDSRHDELFDQNSYIFKLSFDDQASVEIWAHSSFPNPQDAKTYAEAVVRPLGKLPKAMRAKLNHVVLHKGNETAFSEHLGHFFVLYSENITRRLSDNDLEETVFHESVHATLDYKHSNDPVWIRAQRKDNAYVTQYGQQNPKGEDLAETALFAYSRLINSERLPTKLTEWLDTNIPNRLKYLSNLFSNMESDSPQLDFLKN